MLDMLANESVANFATVVEAGATVIALLYARREWKDSKRQREQQVQEQLDVERERMAQERERAVREEERINDQIRLLSIDLIRPVFISESQGSSGQTSGNCQARKNSDYFEALRIINHSDTTFRNFEVIAWGFYSNGANRMNRFVPFLPQGEYILCLPSAGEVFRCLRHMENVNPLIPIDRLDELILRSEKEKFFLSTRYRNSDEHQGFPEEFSYKASCQDIRNTTWRICGENGAIGGWQKDDEA